ncbi:polyamine ABC transporter substrate-binding protein [Rhodoplanes serenus]|uniref:polyamine ABC transporter substrate-binding protein n=1 Tax=Rhodoplanes serenus TaxID=200615 RepID=UPI000DAE4B3A|nr:polyamine ABC transporter substrate-binding protein [Rhodoplanes serenus]RAI36194.1 spermidine/putrescine ABC transporter substrate-binding protein PotF [Rhodoplanes serenus]
MRAVTSLVVTRRAVTRRLVAAVVLGASALAAVPMPVGAQERVVNIYNWSDYIAPTVIDDFTRETGIKVRYDTFDSNDTLETKLLAGRTGYDVVVPSAYFLERQIKAGVFLPLDKSKLPNLKNAWPEIERRVASHDPDNRYSVNYLWGTVGIGYNVAKVRDVLGPDGRIESWKTVFEPESLARFKDCGVHVLDSADDIMPAALHHLGLPPSSEDPKDLERAAELLGKIRPFVRKFHSSEYLNALASGEICLVVGFSGDIMQAKKRAAEAKNGVEIGYTIPQEGAQMFFDNLAIPKDAAHVAEAHAFIDYLMRPEVAAKNTSFLSYANGNLASQALIDKAVLDDRSIYPEPAVMARLYTNKARDAKTTRLMNRLWTRVKTGR